jgi:molybdopterin-guanine dinucleotide biosynthesis protein A
MGRDKAGLLVGRRTLLQRTVDRVRAAGGEPLVIGPLRTEEEVAAAPQSDERGQPVGPAGPLGALRHGLVRCGTPVALALACDLPLLTADFLRFLAGGVGELDAVVPRAAGTLHVLAAAYRRSCLDALDECVAGGATAVHELIAKVRVKFLEEADLMPFGGPAILMNVNTPEDLARARDRLAGEGG